jgi:hypothetical protein
MIYAIISAFSIIIPLVGGLLAFDRLKELKSFFYFIVVACIFELVSDLFAFQKLNTHPIGNLYCLVEFCFLFSILLKWNSGFSIKGKTTALLLLPFIGFWFYNLYSEGIYKHNEINMITVRIILMLSSGYYLLKFVLHSEEDSPFVEAKFWIASGIFIYFTSTIVIYSMSRILLFGESRQLAMYYSYFNSTINLIGNLIYFIGFLCRLQRKKSFSL